MSQFVVEIINMELSVESRVGDYAVKIEKGDLKQNGTVYPSMVRRVTLTNPSGEATIQVFRGHDCTKKASKWLKQASEGHWKPDGTEWMWL